MNKFTKADLKPNMIVQLRRGDYEMVYDFDGELILVGSDSRDKLSSYDNNLTVPDCKNFDIIAVKKPNHAIQFNPKYWDEAPTIWVREEITESLEG